MLLLELLEAFGQELTEAHFQVAGALEMIHTGSLIHDDLLAMDNDDYRRGAIDQPQEIWRRLGDFSRRCTFPRSLWNDCCECPS